MTTTNGDTAEELADRAANQAKNAGKNAGRAAKTAAEDAVEATADKVEDIADEAADVADTLLKKIQGDAAVGTFALTISIYSGAVAFAKFRKVFGNG